MFNIFAALMALPSEHESRYASPSFDAASGYPRRMTTPTPRPALEGRLVRLRSYEAADYGSLNELFNDPDVGVGVGIPVPQAVAGHREFVEGGRSQKDRTLSGIETLEGRGA